ncbi:MAG TPA: hypothetical protein DEV93_15995 [Chloroflexi bacterium]|jgi:hypothetical protein|nr:hypothetical protein [Chloroflexota bacterium]
MPVRPEIVRTVLTQLHPGEGRDVVPPKEPATPQQSTSANSTSLLDGVAMAIEDCGVKGETALVKLIYLAVTSRLLKPPHRPVSVAVKGPSAGGKSFVVETVLGAFPKSAYYAISGMSEHALAYSEEPLSHRMLVVYEAAGLASDFASYLMRSLLSEGRVRYETVEKTAAGMKARLIEREGPTGLIVTTTSVSLHPENETRLLSLTVTDTQEQTKLILASLADNRRSASDLGSWIELQEWLEEQGPQDVEIPYASRLAEMVPPVAVRLRRDFGAVLSLIRAHALLHQASRQRDAENRIIATAGDYGVVRDLVAPLLAEGVGATVSATVRATVERVTELTQPPATAGEVSLGVLATSLTLDKSTASRRVAVCIQKGYLLNRQDQRGKPMLIATGDPLPDELEVLPTPDKLFDPDSCTVAGYSEGVMSNGGTHPEEDGHEIPSNDPATVQQPDQGTQWHGPLTAVATAFPWGVDGQTVRE